MPLFNLKSKRGVAISRKGEFFYEYLLPDDSIFVLVITDEDVITTVKACHVITASQ